MDKIPTRKIHHEQPRLASNNSNQTAGIAVIIAILVIALFFITGGKELLVKSEKTAVRSEYVTRQMQSINNRVADDAVTQFEIAARSGDKMQMYTQAGLCVAAFLQAKDEINYRKWLDIQHKLAQEIGLPQ